MTIAAHTVQELRRDSPSLLASLASATTDLLARSLIAEPADREVLLRGIDVLAALATGLLSGEDKDLLFLESVFFGGETRKCPACSAAVLDAAWRVCPYCEKKLFFPAPAQSGLAQRVGSTLVSLFFVSGFSVLFPLKEWRGDEPYNDAILNAREHLLGAMLIFLSVSLVSSQADLASRRHNRWLDALLTAPRASDFFSSLLTVALTAVTPGWISFSEDKRENVRRASLNLLLILLAGRIPNEASYTSEQLIDDNDRSLAVDFVRGINCKSSIESIIQMLNSADLFAHACGLLWNFAQMNSDFCDALFLTGNCGRVIVPLLAFISAQKGDVKSHATINLAVFILLSFSSRRAFGIALNLPLGNEGRLLPKSSIEKESNPSIADALVIVVENVISANSVDALYECLLMVLCNISPYQKTLSMTASVALMRLFVLFSTRTHLLKAERSHDLLTLTLDCISNILQYQYEGNRPLTYAVVSYRERFYRIFDLISDKEFTVEAFADGRFSPKPFHTREWFDGWRKALPARVIAKVLDEIVPLLEKMEANQADAVIECSKSNTCLFIYLFFLFFPHTVAKTTIVGVLPPPPPIVIRRSLRSKETDVWIATFLWSVVYSNNKTLAPLEPRLFAQ